jgi:hypothetical protein
LIKTARIYHQMKKAERYGLPQPVVMPVNFGTVGSPSHIPSGLDKT